MDMDTAPHGAVWALTEQQAVLLDRLATYWSDPWLTVEWFAAETDDDPMMVPSIGVFGPEDELLCCLEMAGGTTWRASYGPHGADVMAEAPSLEALIVALMQTDPTSAAAEAEAPDPRGGFVCVGSP